jgi:hypothetical protein
MAKPPPHVTMARLDLWQVKGGDDRATLLKGLGFRRKSMLGGHYEAAFDPPLDFENMAIVARLLIEGGFAFSGGRDWSPSEVVQDLRDRRLLFDPFDEIAWKGPGDWVVRTL